ncbi:MAG: Uma2 family endonuclease [Chloroflexia bacterium]|nr:Uma2 family endonuclease [Chloroflexia bacterium]
MSVQTRPLTYDDLCQTPDDGNRYEIIDGELIVSPAPNLDHQRLLGELFALVRGYVRQHRLGRVFLAPVDVRLSAHDVVEPDLLFIRRERRDIYGSRRYVQGPPDLVVEIISPSSEKTDPGRKFDLYASSGVPEYWLMDPATRRFQLFVLREGRYEEMAAEAEHLRSEVIPGLVVDPGALFAELDQD